MIIIEVGDKVYTSIIQANINLIPFNIIEKTFYLNILMLVPFGFLVPFIWKNYRKFYKTLFFRGRFFINDRNISINYEPYN